MGKRNAEVLGALDGRNGVWSIGAWCMQTGMSHVTFGHLDPPPHFTKIGRLKRITESPRDYLDRVRQLQTGKQNTARAERAIA
jgi:hypothetical protein